jgi:putative hemin transport protein
MITTDSLRERWATFKEENPKSRIRDAAQQLGVSEADLLATQIGETVVKLEGDFQEILKEVPTLGYVMALTRNDNIVHERKGIYENVSFNGHVGLVVGPDIDLRLFMSRWHFGFAVNENNRKSLQFFDLDGSAVHKIYLTDKSDERAYDAIVEKYQAVDQSTILITVPYPEKTPDTPDEEIDAQGFQDAWLAMEDTHQFFGLLRTYKLGREQGYALLLKDMRSLFRLSNSKKYSQLRLNGKFLLWFLPRMPVVFKFTPGQLKNWLKWDRGITYWTLNSTCTCAKIRLIRFG